LPVLLAVLAGGCMTQSVKRVNAVEAERAERAVPLAERLDINIAIFDTGLPPSEEADPPEDVFPEVRRAEARHIPVTLRNTLERTAQWGAVRVVPEPVEWSELNVTGRILHSDGMTLAVQLRATDATGRLWLDKTYSEEAAKLVYDGERPGQDPFQDLYNRMANDLLKVRDELEEAQLREVRRVADLRFGKALTPEAYGPYLEVDAKGHYRAVGLPAEDDPMAQRVARIRQRDYAVIDALDQHYRNFHQEVDDRYSEWRRATFDELKDLRELERQSLTRRILGAAAVVGGVIAGSQADTRLQGDLALASIIGGVLAFRSGMAKSEEAEMHAAAVEELGKSLERDVEPRVVAIEDRTVTLSGSAEAQFREWQKLLRQIYAEETGLIAAQEGAGEDADGERARID
jgi:hypothetical protein